MSITAFCSRERIPSASYFFWRRRLRNAPGFTEVKVVPGGAGREDAGNVGVGEANGIELRLGGGRRIVVRRGFDRQTLLDLLTTLEGGA